MKIVNKKAYYNYQLFERIEAGISLLGSEVKAIKAGHADLTGSHVRIIGLEAYLVNARVFPYSYSRPETYEENRTRKLFLHKNEIISLKSKIEGQHLTLVPISLYTIGNLIKLEIAIAKGKKEFEKKSAIKKQDIERQQEIDLADFGY